MARADPGGLHPRAALLALALGGCAVTGPSQVPGDAESIPLP
jgi:hypothetical protein